MKKTLIFLLCSVMNITAFAQNFDDFFEDKTLRVDYIFTGDAGHLDIYLDELSRLPEWAGRRHHLSEIPLGGNGEITMKDKATGQVIYRTSFSSLFQEWVTEEEASRVRKGFENSFLLPYPKKEAVVTVALKNVYHKVSTSLTHEVNPNDILIHQRGLARITPHRYLLQSGSSKDCIDVAIMADSTSRWAEALRELSGRLEEMPAEEGFPAYLASRLSAFYERAGMMHNLNGTDGSVTIIGAVSPQGGDFSEPVTQNTKRFVRCFWGLDKSLAYARHFPAIHWLTSYSEYLEDLTPWYREHVSPKFVADRNQLMAILNQESSLMEIVKLIGSDVLPDDQKLTLEIARVIRLGFLQQNAFHAEDTCVPMEKQFKMMETILYLYEKCRALINRGMPVSVLKEGNNIFEKIISIKYDVANNQLDKFDQYKQDIDTFYDNIMEKNG